MKTRISRRRFTVSLAAAAAGLSLPRPFARAAESNSFSFVLLGDLHYDKLEHHNLDWLGKTKPDDLRQVREYSALTSAIMPRLFETVRANVTDSANSKNSRVSFVAHVGDLVEGLCSNETLALRQDNDALAMLRQAKLGVPFVFAKGNHDITGPGADVAFKESFYPFLNEQRSLLNDNQKLSSAFYAFEHGDALFCFFDAYDRTSLDWLESVLARRTARHCFVIIHPPVVPYGARATWHLYSNEREKPRREHLLELLGKQNAFVLTGHIHKYNLLVRSAPGGKRFLQLAISSVIPSLEISATNELSGRDSYNPDQIAVEPNFSPTTEKERRAVYEAEAPFVKRFEYADMPGYAIVTVDGPKVSATIYRGTSRQVWRTLALSDLSGA